MKKLILSAAVAACAASMISCGGSAPKADLKNNVDTLSYAFGLSQSQPLPAYLAQRGIDSTFYAQFMKGINDAMSAGDDKGKNAYYAGLQIGQMIGQEWVKNVNSDVFGEDTTKTISVKNLLAGFLSSITPDTALVTPEKAYELYMQKSDAIKEEAAAVKFAAEKKASEKAMAQIAKQKDVKALANGVYYKVITEGTGEKPTAEAQVKVNYEGSLLVNGSVFDASQEGQPTPMGVGGVIPGFREALLAMPAGSKWEIYIPYDQAYGYREMGDKIPAFSALKFVVELVSIEERQSQPMPMPIQMQ